MHLLTPRASWLLLLLAVPVLLYLLPLPRRRRSVPSTLVWQSVLKLHGMTARRSALRLLLAILLNVLIAVLIIGALGRVVSGPRDETPTETTLVLVLDNSASMQAPVGDVTRFDRAVARAGRLIEQLSGGTRVALAATAPEPTLLVRTTDDLDVMREALRNTRPSDAAAGLHLTLDWIGNTFPENEHLSVHVFTDDARTTVDRGRFTATRHLCGESLSNAGIVAFGARRVDVPEPGVLVRARVANFSDAPRNVQLLLRTDDNDLEPRPLTLVPDTVTTVAWTLPEIDATLLELELTPHDAFALDDRAAAVMEPVRRKRVLLVADASPVHLLAALRADRSLRVFTTKPGSYQPAMPSDLTVVVGEPPRELGPANVLLVALASDPSGVKTLVTGPLSLVRGHPILRDVAWRASLVRETVGTPASAGMTPVVSHGDVPLVLAGVREGRRTVALAFDPETQPITRSRAWPILVRNITGYLAPRESATQSKAWHAGETAPVPVAAGVHEVRLIAPDGTETNVAADDETATLEFPHVGTYRLRAGRTESPLAVNLCSAAESDLRIPSDASGVSAGTGAGTDPAFIWTLMILAATTLVTLEAVLYHRRILE